MQAADAAHAGQQRDLLMWHRHGGMVLQERWITGFGEATASESVTASSGVNPRQMAAAQPQRVSDQQVT